MRRGDPEQARGACRHRYLSVTPVPGLRKVLARMRADFGSVLRIPSTSEAGGIGHRSRERICQCEHLLPGLPRPLRTQSRKPLSGDQDALSFRCRLKSSRTSSLSRSWMACSER